MGSVRVVRGRDGCHCLDGELAVVGVGNRFLDHLRSRRFSPATVRAYAFDVANFAGFLEDRSLDVGEVAPSDLFDYLDWQQAPQAGGSDRVVRLRSRGPAPATMNRRIATVRGLFEYLVMIGERDENPVPVARRSSGLRTGGMLGHTATRPRSGGRLVREPSRLPEQTQELDGPFWHPAVPLL